MAPRKEKGTPSHGEIRNSKVVLTGLADGADRYLLCKTLASELGIPFEEATRMVTSLPHEIFPAIPEEAAEIFAEKIREAGGTVEVLSLSDGLGPFCQRHPHRRARAKCKTCKCYICEDEILGSGRRLYCPDCFRGFKTRRRLRVVAVAGVLVAAVALWFAVRPVVQRMIRFETHDRGKRVRIACVADRMDPQRIRLFNDLGERTTAYRGNRFETLAALLNREYRRYTGSDADFLTLEVTGVHETDPALPVPTETGFAFRDFFRKMEEKYTIEAGQYDAVLFVYLVRADELRDGQDIPALVAAGDGQGVAWFVVDQPDRRDHYLAATLVALGEALGASPKLDPQGRPKYPDGYPDPSLAQYTSSDQFEALAGRRPDAVAGGAPVQDVGQGRVGPRTAYELGWISRSRLKEMTVAAAGK